MDAFAASSQGLNQFSQGYQNSTMIDILDEFRQWPVLRDACNGRVQKCASYIGFSVSPETFQGMALGLHYLQGLGEVEGQALYQVL